MCDPSAPQPTGQETACVMSSSTCMVGGGWPVCRQRDHPGRLGKRWPWPVAGKVSGGMSGEMARPPGTCAAQVASACLSVVVDSDSSIGNSSAPALSDEVSEDQRVEEFVPGREADEEVSQSSSPSVLTPRPPASCSSFLSTLSRMSLWLLPFLLCHSVPSGFSL